MKLTIDNLQGLGPQDYTAQLDGTMLPKVERKLNQPSELRFSLLGNSPGFVIPLAGARVALGKTNGSDVFTGYVVSSPQFEYLGWGEEGPVYRYNVAAQSDEILLDQKALPNRPPFVNRSAGSALRQLAQDLLPGFFNIAAVQDVESLAQYSVNPQKSFSFHAAEIAVASRASFRTMNGALILEPVGLSAYTLSESDADFSPDGLRLDSPNMLVNDVTVIGRQEAKQFVRDYFAGDGLSLKFYLSHKPFAQATAALIDENYLGPGLDLTVWAVNDPSSAVSVAGQTLQIAGGTGVDGQTTVSFIEQVEMGGALELQHGNVSFTGASRGVIGGLYAGAISAAGCLAGFQISPSGSASTIQALINGAGTGPVMGTTPGHQYFFTTYLYAMEIHRVGESYHSSAHPAGSGWGGVSVAADVRFVLEVQDIDPANAATLLAPATVLYDGVIANAPGFCTYSLINAQTTQCSVAFTYATHITLPEVRTALPNSSYITQLVGPAAEGGRCIITRDPALNFYTQYVPALNELIVASYRGVGRSVARVQNAASIAALRSGVDNGTRGIVKLVKNPAPPSGKDCENAALAILDDSTAIAWSGTYETWSDFLPGSAADIFPGDAITVNVPSRGASFTAIIRDVEVEVADPANDRGFYKIGFANDLAFPLAIEYTSTSTPISVQDMPPVLQTTEVGAYYQADLIDAQITAVSSTTVTVDAGVAPGAGFGIEVRANDFGWGQANDRNLLGRFNTQSFSLARLARTQTYFLRLYDSSSPPKYSRYSAALHVDYPL